MSPTAQQDPEAPAAQAEPEGPAEILARRRKPEVRALDFSQPTKFTAELRRRILRALAPFCEAFALRLSTELRAPVELAVGESSQLTWSAAKAQLSADAIAVALDVRPIERQLLLCVEPPLVAQALECLLGGSAAQASPERRLSEIDWALTRRLLQSMVTHLNPTWRDLGGVELQLGEVDVEGDAGVAAPLGEPTFALTLESRIDGLPSGMSLLIPWSAIEPIAGEILGGDRTEEGEDPHEGAAVSRGLANAHICLRAEIGAVRMPVQQMLALAPGSLLAFGETAEQGAQLFAEGVPLGRARPGLRGTRRAIKLTEAIDPGAGAATLKEIGPSATPPIPTLLQPQDIHDGAAQQHASAEQQHTSAEQQHASAEQQHTSAEQQHASAGRPQAAVEQPPSPDEESVPGGEDPAAEGAVARGAGAEQPQPPAVTPPTGGPATGPTGGRGPTPERVQRMLGIPVRVWAELGRTTIPLGAALELPPGSVLELDQAAEAPIELFANGMRFAHGTLQVSDEGEWAVRIDGLAGHD